MSPGLFAQGTKSDYARSQGLRKRFANGVFRDAVRPTWFADGTFSYRIALPNGASEHVLVDPVKGTRMVVPRSELRGKQRVEVPSRAAPGRRPVRREWGSPDGKWSAVIRRGNVVLVDRESKAETRLSDDGSPGDSYGRVLWSPDSRRLVAIQTKSGGDRRVTLVETAPRDRLQPRTVTYPYRKPGDPIPHARPRLFDVGKKRRIPVAEQLFANPWSIGHEHWSSDGRRFYFTYNQRGHTVMRVLSVDADTGVVTPIVDEQCKTFFDYANKTFVRYLDATGELLWMSERDGWNHLYLIDLRTGTVKNRITRGPFVVRRVDEVDVKARELRLQVHGLFPGQDPYHIHHVRVRFDGTELTHLTDGDGTHGPLRFSPDRAFYLVTFSRVDLPPVTELRRAADGKLVLTLERADIGELVRAGWRAPERFHAKGRDGTTEIYGLIHQPTNFDPARKYPVIEYIYAGPHGHHVPKAFRPLHNLPMAMAELGFLVVQIDGMGTNWRSKAFHDVCWKNLGDSGFPDRIRWIRSAAASHPQMDLSRGVGIFGGSAGGQSSTRALLAHGDFYKVAVSDCGCHDNRMDK
ncbi:MAG: DPP IV N-terminal domain-containing protein, partial [Planctomycetes bacterium]|nr:DPP IV N-terminal domain-containing protein [Planctomycetota bacterium]